METEWQTAAKCALALQRGSSVRSAARVGFATVLHFVTARDKQTASRVEAMLTGDPARLKDELASLLADLRSEPTLEGLS